MGKKKENTEGRAKRKSLRGGITKSGLYKQKEVWGEKKNRDDQGQQSPARPKKEPVGGGKNVPKQKSGSKGRERENVRSQGGEGFKGDEEAEFPTVKNGLDERH